MLLTKGEIACNKQFLFFSQHFLLYVALIFHFKMHFKMLSAICFNLDQFKISSTGKGLKNSLGKGDKAVNEYFLLSQQSSLWEINWIF